MEVDLEGLTLLSFLSRLFAVLICGAIIGIACGIGLCVYAIVVSLMAALTLWITELFQTKFGRREQEMDPDPDDAQDSSPAQRLSKAIGSHLCLSDERQVI